MPSAGGQSSLSEIFGFFLRLGLTAFGGPAAHINLMRREAVERRHWISQEHFLDLVGACNLLPGPSSTQVAMAVGYTRRGWAGLTIAGACFILPASLSTLVLAWAYVRFGSLPLAQGLLYGAKPVMVAIIAQAVWNLGRLAFHRWQLAAAGIIGFAAVLAGAPAIAVLLVSGGVALLAAWERSKPRSGTAMGLAGVQLALGSGIGVPIGILPLFLVFLKLGVVVFGSGYVLVAFLKADLVDRLHWVTQPQLLDAITAGQLTPGPVFATATFLGYLLRGWAGAAAATVAIFLPSFFMAGLVAAFAGRMRNSLLAAAFLDGVNAAAVALMASVAIFLGRAAMVDIWTSALALVSALLLVRFKLNATWLILAGAALGILLRATV
jgi:chromate transporter